MVSVPYRGDMISNVPPCLGQATCGSFRPLSGRYDFKSVNVNEVADTTGFRPLSGRYDFKLYFENFIYFLWFCFRPLSGRYDFKYAIGTVKCPWKNRFRPLSGRYDFKFEIKYGVYSYPFVSVPYRGDMISNNLNLPILLSAAYSSFRPLSGRYDFKLGQKNW